MEIKVGYIVAYDCELLKHSLPTVYGCADKVVIAIDKNRRTFTGGTYTTDPSFFSWLREVDTEKKITIYEDSFYVAGLSANEADTRERNMLAKKMGKGGWHFQVDVDEYFINFKHLVTELRRIEPQTKGRKVSIQIYCTVVFKVLEEGYLVVDDSPERFVVATNFPEYTFHRYHDGNERCFINHMILHQSWGRTEDDLKRKLKNWSHHADFDTAAYFNFWKSINLDNYRYISDFHPLYRGYWKKLAFIKTDSVESLLQRMSCRNEKESSNWSSRLRNWLPPVLYNKLPKHYRVKT